MITDPFVLSDGFLVTAAIHSAVMAG